MKWLCHYMVVRITYLHLLHLCIYTFYAQLGLLSCNGKIEFYCLKDEHKIIYFALAMEQLPYTWF